MTREYGLFPLLTALGPPTGWLIGRFFSMLEAKDAAKASHASYIALLEVVKAACN